MVALQLNVPTTTAASHSESNSEASDDVLADAVAAISTEDLKGLDIDALLACIGEDTQEGTSISAFNKAAGPLSAVTRGFTEPKVGKEDGVVGATLLRADAHGNLINTPNSTDRVRQNQISASSSSPVQNLTPRSSRSSTSEGSVIAGAVSETSSSSVASVHRQGPTSTTSTRGLGSRRASRNEECQGAQEDDDITVIETKPVVRPSVRKRHHEAARNANTVEEPAKKFYRFLKAYERVADYAQFSMNELGDPKKFVAKRDVMKQWIEFNTNQK